MNLNKTFCQNCGRIRELRQFEVNRGQGKYCGQRCANKTLRDKRIGANNPAWKGKTHAIVDGVIQNVVCQHCSKPIEKPTHVNQKYHASCKGIVQGYRQRGRNNPGWKGGASTEEKRIRGSKDYLDWRDAIYARDNWTCQDCGDRNYSSRGQTLELNAHHIFAFADFPEHRFAVWNGVTLCVVCHAKYHPEVGLFSNKGGVREV